MVEVCYITLGLGVATVIFIFYLFKFYTNNYWKKLGVPFIPPVPFFGNDFYTTTGLKTICEMQIWKYNYLKDNKYGGTFFLSIPIFFVRDPELIEHILVKDFSYFYNRGMKANEKLDPLAGHLFNLEGKRWKNLRNKLAPAFTSGKLKTMHQQLIDCTDVLIDFLKFSDKIHQSIDFKETMAKFTTDVIGACAYGLNINALRNPDCEFREMGKKVFQTSFKFKAKRLLKIVFRKIHPSLLSLIKIKMLPAEVENFFLSLVKDTIKVREENNITRNDFIQLLINLRKQDVNISVNESTENSDQERNEEVVLNDNVMAANAFLFFIAGFETTASTLSYCLFELSKNQDIQEQVYNEIKDVMSKYGGLPTYDAIKQMPLLDMVISETMRKYPPGQLLMRECSENYIVPESDLVLPKGCMVEIPVYAIHHDPNIYPDPEKFVPDRFTEENKSKIPKGAYLPFGDGPRICIGARFAQMEMKVCLCKVLTNFKIYKSSLMGDRIIFDPKGTFVLMPKGGIWLNIEEQKEFNSERQTPKHG